jgi:alkylation response protein AidB-like acyl-CoA dehydrogenase
LLDGTRLDRYVAPIADMLLDLQVGGLNEILALPAFSQLDQSDVELALREFGRFAGNVVGPTNGPGDVKGSALDRTSGAVHAPAPLCDVYAQYVKSGWGAAQFPAEYGGGGLPSLVGIAFQEMFASANLSLSLNAVLTQSAIELLLAWGSEAQRALYVPRLLTGEWCGTMNLTETEAGSDLGEVRSRAVQDSSGRWRVSGTKIFITWGEHDMAENIVHLVLARTPHAPSGTKGLSLFVVPKMTVGKDGTLVGKNTVRCLRLERKLGIHASPTCAMEFDEALGELVGPEHGGIAAMFTMMNAARISIGLQGPAVAERAFQHAYRYALERQQGRASGVVPPTRSSIIDHPDVRRMLLSMRTSLIAGRLLLYSATGYRDLAREATTPELRSRAQAFVDLLTPVAKAWSSDAGFAATSTGLQVLGGAGFIEETGMAQHLRDVRIASIYEGTNGIQAIDLVTRKLPREQGQWIHALLDDIAHDAEHSPRSSSFLTESHEVLSDALAVLRPATEHMLNRAEFHREDVLSGASAYLELLGLTLGGWLMMRRAETAKTYRPEAASQAESESEFFATEHVARASGLGRAILTGVGRLSGIPLPDQPGYP